MQNARHPKTHRELCELACRFLRNNGFKVVFSDRFHAWTSCGEHPDALGFRNGASCLIEVKCSRSDFLADRKKVFRSEPGPYLVRINRVLHVVDIHTPDPESPVRSPAEGRIQGSYGNNGLRIRR